MIPFEEVKQYLPQYLSAESQRELFRELKSFPGNISDRNFYTTFPPDASIIYQGDGLNGMVMINLPSSEIRPHPAMILSNTCDLDLANRRISDTRILYAPIFKLENYKNMLCDSKQLKKEQIEQHINEIKKQYISQFFYLPAGQGLGYEGVVPLDRIVNCPRNAIGQEFIDNNRMFMLSNYGFYLLLIKVSIHLTRVREGVDRPLQPD